MVLIKLGRLYVNPDNITFIETCTDGASVFFTGRETQDNVFIPREIEVRDENPPHNWIRNPAYDHLWALIKNSVPS